MHADAEAALRRIAANQHSVFTRGQALRAGMSPKTIDRYLARGRWVRIHSGVYVAADVVVGWRQQMAGALLACGPKAVASHRGACAVWAFAEDLFAPEVTVPREVVREREGILIHRYGLVEGVHRDGFRVTKPARTLIDLAGCIPDDRLDRIVDDAHRRRLFDMRRLAADLSRPENITRRGAGVLREMVASRNPDRPIDSDLETIFFAALRKCRLPLPVPQHPVMTLRGQKYIDFAYPDRMVAIELDGWEEHGTKRAFVADRARQNELERLGWRFNRFTWSQVKSDDIGVGVAVGLMLGLVPARWRRT